jgi:hypothetical protein
MLKLTSLSTVVRQNAAGTPALLTMVAGLASAFLFATTSSTIAQGGPPERCTLCHKGKATITVPCNSSAFERHTSHGDTTGACGSTQSAKSSTDTEVVAAKRTAVAPSTAARVQKSVE